jgi:hypothetical protein
MYYHYCTIWYQDVSLHISDMHVRPGCCLCSPWYGNSGLSERWSARAGELPESVAKIDGEEDQAGRW